MRGMLLTGGAGYVGSHAVKLFHAKGYKLVVLDNLFRGRRDFARWGTFIEGDIGDASLLKKIFQEHKIECVSHFAALAYVGESVEKPELYFSNNVSKARVLLEASLKHGVKAFQFSSSCAVYGLPAKLPIAEDHPRNPVSPYGESKRQFEDLLCEAAAKSSMKISILRYFNAAGADPEGELGEDHRPETHIIPLALEAAATGKTLTVFGGDFTTRDGTPVRDYLHVSDIARAHQLAMEAALSGQSSTLNLGAGRGVSVKELVLAIEKITSKKIKLETGPRRRGDPGELYADSSRAFNVLGWKPVFSDLENILRTAWLWYEKRGRK